jgi:hypothetical protein
MEDTIEQILSLKNNKEIEQATSCLSLEQTRALLQYLSLERYRDKVAPVITGLPAEYFPQLLLEKLSFFKKLVNLEPLQHKLILLATEIGKDLAGQKANALLEQENFLRSLPPSLLYEQCHPALKRLTFEINQIETTVHALLELAWLSERTDFIELSSKGKEHLAHLQLYLESLKKSLKEKLDTLFESEDTTHAIEGIAAMGVIYPEDVRAFLQRADENSEFLSEQALVKKLQELLEKVGLLTVKDLKDKEIYNLELLVQFLKKVEMFPHA